MLLRAADLIGQLGDPNYLRKANALFYEFEEIGLNKKLGYETPADVVYKYPQFYWSNVAPQIQGDKLLNITKRAAMDSKLYGTFSGPSRTRLSGPQHGASLDETQTISHDQFRQGAGRRNDGGLTVWP